MRSPGLCDDRHVEVCNLSGIIWYLHSRVSLVVNANAKSTRVQCSEYPLSQTSSVSLSKRVAWYLTPCESVSPRHRPSHQQPDCHAKPGQRQSNPGRPLQRNHLRQVRRHGPMPRLG